MPTNHMGLTGLMTCYLECFISGNFNDLLPGEFHQWYFNDLLPGVLYQCLRAMASYVECLISGNFNDIVAWRVS